MKWKLAFKILVRNPGLFWLKLRSGFYKAKSLLSFFSKARPGIHKIGAITLRIDSQMIRDRPKYFSQTADPELEACLRKYLKPGDVFIDVGANVGYFTALALHQVGVRGEVHAFEPVRQYCEHLYTLQKDNPDHRLMVIPAGLGSRRESKTIYLSSKDMGWNTVIRREIKDSQVKSTEIVEILCFDDYAREKNLKNIRMIKIDVEGFEPEVLRGMKRVLTEQRPVIYCEVSSHIYPALNYSLKELLEEMGALGYRGFDAHDIGEEKFLESYESQSDVLFLKMGDR